MMNNFGILGTFLGVLGGLIYLVIVVYFMVVMWRIMRTAEGIRETLKEISGKMKV